MKRVAVFLTLAACGGSTTTDATDSGTTDASPIDTSVDTIDITEAAPPGAPITGLTAGQWSWVDFPNAFCRDGTATGIGVSPSNTGSTKLMIFLEGGGACFNADTCAANPAHFDGVTFAAQFAAAESLLGIFSRSDSNNALADWNMVYVPYCTGDVHAGSAPNAQVPGFVGMQQFVGYTNIGNYLSRILPTFPTTTRVLLTGQSAGGFGAALNYARVARAFGNVTVDLLDDSGPLMGNPTLAACLEESMSTLWGLSSTVIGTDCGSDCNDPGNDLFLLWEHLPKTYPNARFGFVDSTGDSVISSFFGYGASNCKSFAAIGPAQYEAALLAMRTAVASDANAGSFLFAGGDHTSLVAAYTTRTTNGLDGGTVALEPWISDLVTSSVTNAGP